MTSKRRRRVVALLRSVFCFVFLSTPFFSWAVIDALPASSRGYISDYTNELSGMDDVEERLAVFHEEHGYEIMVVVLPSLPIGMSMDDAARTLYERWSVGSSTRDDGVLVLAVLDLQQVRIEVGYGLRDILTDDVVLTLLQTTIAPAFSHGDYDGGVRAVSLALMSVLEKESPTMIASVSSGRLGVAVIIVLVVLFVGVAYFLWWRSRRRFARVGQSKYRTGVNRRVVTDL